MTLNDLDDHFTLIFTITICIWVIICYVFTLKSVYVTAEKCGKQRIEPWSAKNLESTENWLSSLDVTRRNLNN